MYYPNVRLRQPVLRLLQRAVLSTAGVLNVAEPRQCLHIVSVLPVTFNPLFSFCDAEKPKYFDTSDLKLAEASAVSETLPLGSPLVASNTLTRLLDRYKGAECKG